jgi:hypothetical protein
MVRMVGRKTPCSVPNARGFGGEGLVKVAIYDLDEIDYRVA